MPKKSATAYNKAYSVLLLNIALSAPRHSALGSAQKNAAPIESMVGRRENVLWTWETFATNAGFSLPKPLPPDFNPFHATPNPFEPGHLFASETKRAVIAAGLEWLHEHAPQPSKVEGGLGAWVVRQLTREKRLTEFDNVWTGWVDARGRQGLRQRLNQAIDNNLVEAEFHLSQLTQEDSESVTKDFDISEAERVQMKLLAMIGAFGVEICEVRKIGLDLRSWAIPGANALFRLCFDRWRREITIGKKALMKALKKADEEMKGERFTVPASGFTAIGYSLSLAPLSIPQGIR